MYVCVKDCYPNKLVRVGDVVEDSVASLVPNCFKKLSGKTKLERKFEIDEILGADDDDVQMYTSSDLRKPLPPINGSIKRQIEVG